MKEHPIIFSSEMVRAYLDGRKTQTRRIIKPQPGNKFIYGGDVHPDCPDFYRWRTDKRHGYGLLHNVKRKYQVGDRLWVRETFAIFDVDADEDIAIGYKADNTYKSVEWFLDKRKYFNKLRLGKWRSSIHMPKWAARIFLEITNIRVERVQDISIADCVAEGIQRLRGPLPPCPDTAFQDYSGKVAECGAIASFRTLWDSINAKRGYGWDKNPWVRCIEFKRKENTCHCLG